MPFDLHDSGQREQFESGAVRDTRTGKGRFDLITPIGLRRLAIIYERGAVKYAPRNWEAGMPISRCIDSALRHINQYKEGWSDEDHLAQAAWNLFAAMHFEEVKPELQDLPTRLPVLRLTLDQALDLPPLTQTNKPDPIKPTALDKLRSMFSAARRGGVAGASSDGTELL